MACQCPEELARRETRLTAMAVAKAKAKIKARQGASRARAGRIRSQAGTMLSVLHGRGEVVQLDTNTTLWGAWLNVDTKQPPDRVVLSWVLHHIRASKLDDRAVFQGARP